MPKYIAVNWTVQADWRRRIEKGAETLTVPTPVDPGMHQVHHPGKIGGVQKQNVPCLPTGSIHPETAPTS